MSITRFRVLGTALLCACSAALVVGAVAGANNGQYFVLGVTSNTASIETQLNTTGPTGLGVLDSQAGAVAIHGQNTTTSSGGWGVHGETNSNGPNGVGVYGNLNGTAPAGSTYATSAGVRGLTYSKTDNGPGVYGLHYYAAGSSPGVSGETLSTDAQSTGVLGTVNPASPGANSAGVRGVSNGTGADGVGVFGSQAGSGYAILGVAPAGWGVFGRHSAADGTHPGVEGDTNSKDKGALGVLGKVTPASPGMDSAAVRGINNGTGSNGIGVSGSQAGQGIGVYGFTPGGNGVVGKSNTGKAGYFIGDVQVTGTLTKGAGAFRIDHPLDPAHKYLQHSFVESPDMKDVYDGSVTTGPGGYATVKLPAYFQALNRDFRYQLTIVGPRGWNARVVRPIAHNRFVIQTDTPRVRVSWQVTGIRHDPYADAHRIQVVVPKPKAEQGRYLHPELYRGRSR